MSAMTFARSKNFCSLAENVELFCGLISGYTAQADIEIGSGLILR
jgi:hypothetical protein